MSGLPAQEKQRQTELTLLSELLAGYSETHSEQQELREQLETKDKEISLLRSKLDTTESMLEQERFAAELLHNSLQMEAICRIETEQWNEFMVWTYAASVGRSDALQRGVMESLGELSPAVAEELDGFLLPDEVTPPPMEHHALAHGS